LASFGEQLRRERERKGMQLEDVSLATKVGTRFLRALEEERLDQLPGGIFNKGFIRAYARHLGLDENEIVDEYLALVEAQAASAAGLVSPPVEERASHQRSAEQSQAKQKPAKNGSAKERSAKEKPAGEKSRNGAPGGGRVADKRAVVQSAPLLKPKPAFHVPTDEALDHADRVPWGKLAFGLLVVAFAFALWGSFSRQPWEPRKPHTEKPAAVEPAVKPAVHKSEPANEGTSESPAPAAAEPVAQSSPSVQLSASADSGSGHVSPASSQTPDTDAARGAFIVLIQARQDSWLQITVDGKEIMQDVLSAPRQKAVSAQKEVVIKAGNIGGLEFSFNGRKLPAQGEEDEVKTLTFGADGLQVSRKPLEAQTGRPQA